MDNLRGLLTVLVVAHHAAQPCGPTGGEWPQWLSANACSVYLIHLLVIVGVQLLVALLAIGPLGKFGLVMLTGTPLYFAFSALLQRLR